MSHVVSIALKIKSLDDLRIAAAACGLELVEASTYRWYGRYMSDSPLPEGFTADELGKCKYALRVRGNQEAYEAGVVPSKTHPGSYELLFDYWGQHGKALQNCLGENGNRIRQEYAAATANRVLRKQGLRLTRTMTADGKIVLKAMR